MSISSEAAISIHAMLRGRLCGSALLCIRVCSARSVSASRTVSAEDADVWLSRTTAARILRAFTTAEAEEVSAVSIIVGESSSATATMVQESMRSVRRLRVSPVSVS